MKAFEMLGTKRILLKGGLALALALLGMVVGYLLREQFLSPYRVVSSISLNNAYSYIQAKPSIESLSNLNKYAATHGLKDDAAILAFSKQLERSQNWPVELELTYPITRLQIKELPDAVSKEILKQQNLRPSLSVAVVDRNESEAIHKQQVIVNYARDMLLQSAITNWLRGTLADSQRKLASIVTDAAAAKWQVESLSRQIESMEAIRDKYRQALASDMAKQAGSGSELIQIPTNETRFISPERQLVALWAQKGGVIEHLRLADGKKAMAKVSEQYAAQMLKKASEQVDGYKLLKAAFAAVQTISTDSTDVDVKLAVDQAQGSLRQTLLGLRETFVDTVPRAQPLVYRVGPSRMTSLGAGAIAGLLAWLVIIGLFSRTEFGRRSETTPMRNGKRLSSAV